MAWLKSNYVYIVGLILLAASIAARIFSYPVVSGDYTSSLSHWMDALRGSPGLTAFQNPFSDYSPLYLYMLKLLTYASKQTELFWIKSLSLVFDVILALVTLMIIRQVRSRPLGRGAGVLMCAIVFAIPTVVLNSSLWGQCDSIYTSFVLLSLYFILCDKPAWASVAFGVAISFKLQAIFFLPILIGFLFARGRRYELLLVPAVYLLTLVPAALAGGSFLGLLFTYVSQAGEFAALTLSAPSVFAFLDQSSTSPLIQSVVSILGYVITFVLAIGICLYSYTLFMKKKDWTRGRVLLLSLFCALVIPYFLPHMHERYFYLADVLSVVYALYKPRRWYIPVVIVASSFFAYMEFLSGGVSWFGRLVVPMWPFSLALLAITLRLFLVVSRR